MLDLDIRKFFDTVEHDWLIRMLQHRIQDRCLLKVVARWINVGIVDESGKRCPAHIGVPHGAVISPLLSNIYLHYVFDLWSHKWRTEKARGDVIITRYADDAVVGFQNKWDANEYRVKLSHRLQQFGLSLHADKNRLIRFGRFAAEHCISREGKPETFDFLGLLTFARRSAMVTFRLGVRHQESDWSSK